jgi:hypothetical protein
VEALPSSACVQTGRFEPSSVRAFPCYRPQIEENCTTRSAEKTYLIFLALSFTRLLEYRFGRLSETHHAAELGKLCSDSSGIEQLMKHENIKFCRDGTHKLKNSDNRSLWEFSRYTSVFLGDAC